MYYNLFKIDFHKRSSIRINICTCGTMSGILLLIELALDKTGLICEVLEVHNDVDDSLNVE